MSSNHPYRIFLATPKDCGEEVVAKYHALTLDKFKAALKHDDVEVVKAEDDFHANFSRCGGWDSWCSDVGRGVDYLYRTPRYNAIVCIHQQVGKATASIVRSALEVNRMVVCVLPDDSYQRVMAVDELDKQDYKGGWLLRIDN